MKNKGIWFAIAVYVIWGVFPLYWKMLSSVPVVQIVANRMVWALVFLILAILVRREGRNLLQVIRSRRTLLIYAAAGALLAVNWLVYIWGINAGYVVEASLGYFVNPLVSVLMGVIVFGEKLPPTKWIPIALAAVGVLYLAISYGSLPWISLALAFTFAFYGLVKKLAPLGTLHGLTLEMALLFLPAAAYLLFVNGQGSGAFGHASLWVNLLLVFSGIVTAVPLLLFASAAHRIPLSMIGVLQYISPTLQFFLGVFIFNEPFNHQRLIGFCIIWLALLLFSLGGIYERHKSLSAVSA